MRGPSAYYDTPDASPTPPRRLLNRDRSALQSVV